MHLTDEEKRVAEKLFSQLGFKGKAKKKKALSNFWKKKLSVFYDMKRVTCKAKIRKTCNMEG